MNIVKAASDWAKAEIFSAQIFIFCGVLFLLGSTAFWQLGKTVLTNALIFPVLVAGVLLLAAGLGFYFSNKTRLSNFESDFKANPATFIESEIERTEKTIDSYENVAFKVFPAIIVLAVLLLIFIDRPIWRAINIVIIGFFVVTILLDSKAHSSIKVYREQLKVVEKDLNN
ncbi:MAG: hypothetical protein AAFO82_00415 [Bacteroidota bacterium]